MVMCLCQCLLISMVLSPVWSLSIDIILKFKTSTESTSNVGCRQNLSTSLTVSWVTYPNDLFVAAKQVHSKSGHIFLHATACTSESPLPTCSDFLQMHKQVFISSITLNSKNASMQDVFSMVNPEKTDNTVKVIHSILTREKWNEFIVFTSEREVLTSISSCIQSSYQMLFTVDDKTDLQYSLTRIYTLQQEEELNFVVLCSTKCILKLLHQAHMLESDMLKRSRWLVIPAEENTADVLQTQAEIKTDDVVFVQFPRCSEKYPILNLTIMEHRFSKLQNSSQLKNPLYFADLQREITRREPVVNPTVYLVHKTKNDTTLVSGGYIGNNGVVLNETLFPGIKYGFNNKTLVVATIEWPPFVFKKEENNSYIYSGICIDLLNELAARFNFSYDIVVPDDNEFGRFVNGTWTGLVGLLENETVDLSVAPLTVDASREFVMDFSVPFFYVRSAILLKKPDPNANKWMTLVAPFRYEVHICILLSLIFSTVFLFVVEEVNPVNTQSDNTLSVRRARYGNILWYHFGALMANGGAYLPNSQTGRCVLACWWLLTMISAAVYSGNFIAFLTDWREKPPFSSLDEMVEQKTYQWGTLGGSIYINLFQDSNRSLYTEIWNGISTDLPNDPDVLSKDSNVHLNKILTSQYAYIAEETLMKLWQTENCDLQTLKEDFLHMSYGVGLPNNSIYTAIFSEQILKISESGLVDLWYKKWMPKDQCETSVSARRVDLLALQSVFYASGVGVLLALSVLIAELLYNKHCNKMQESKTSVEEKETTCQSQL